MEDVLKEGEVVKFKVVGRDEKTGKIKLSRKVLLPKPEGYVERPERPRGERDDAAIATETADHAGKSAAETRTISAGNNLHPFPFN